MLSFKIKQVNLPINVNIINIIIINITNIIVIN